MKEGLLTQLGLLIASSLVNTFGEMGRILLFEGPANIKPGIYVAGEVEIRSYEITPDISSLSLDNL